jgi:hypothetical protein
VPSVIHIARDWLGRYAVFGSNNKDVGASATLTASMGDFNLSGSARRIWTGGVTGLDDLLEDLAFSQTQVSVSAFHLVGVGSIGLRVAMTDRDNADRTWTVAPTFRYPLGYLGGWSVDLLGDASVSERETIAFVRLNFR